MKKYRVINGFYNRFKEGEIVTFFKKGSIFEHVSFYVNEKGRIYALHNEKSSNPDIELIEDNDHSSYHEEMKQLYDSNYELFVEKNRKYGSSFQDTFRNLGQISALTRMTDKFNRLTTMMLSQEVDNEESVIDTLLDLSNYALMTVYELQQKEKYNE